jgi:hypothetical protein
MNYYNVKLDYGIHKDRGGKIGTLSVASYLTTMRDMV